MLPYMGLLRLYQDPASVSVLDAYFQPSATCLGSRGPSDAAAYSGGLRTLLTAWAWPNVTMYLAKRPQCAIRLQLPRPPLQQSQLAVMETALFLELLRVRRLLASYRRGIAEHPATRMPSCHTRAYPGDVYT